MAAASTALSYETLAALRRLTQEADALIEVCVGERLSLAALMERFLPALEGWLGARGAVLATRNEHLVEQTFTWGQWHPLGGADLHAGPGVVRVGAGTALLRRLVLAGHDVGRIAVLFDGDRAADAATLDLLVEAACAELDVVLATVHTAAHKQRLIVEVEELLTDPVFNRGVDQAVRTMHREIRLPDFVLVYSDDIERGRVRYRAYRHGELTASTEGPASPALDRAVAEQGHALLAPRSDELRRVTELPHAIVTLLSSGMGSAEVLGKVLCAAEPQGFSTFALDVVEILCEAMSQRLVDFNRERRHLAQFFAPDVITELLKDPAYLDRYLTPREETVAVLYADINSFTKISEQILVEPPAIAAFVDRWSARAVALLWEHGGVFDKMVGDCVIGLFGPPLFRDSPPSRALAALGAARDIAAFTNALGDEPPYDRIARSGVVPGLGVAIGLNLCPMSVGLMGPNQDYTGFSAGMNSTARLQSLAGFRETVAMEGFCEAVRGAGDALADATAFGDV
ncbi:MAG TPA: adenylate/guanylate cyclase domain-containing protein, partial [Byssovorax sp.]